MNKFIVKPNKSVKEIIDSNGWRATEKRVESVEEINLIRKEAERQFILDEFNAFGVYATQRGIPVRISKNETKTLTGLFYAIINNF